MISREEFAWHIKDALRNLYDPVHLENQPLIGLLGVQRSLGATEGEMLHGLLRETIEQLRPDSSVPIRRVEWLGYRLLWLHYVRCVSQEETCADLSISEATFFRHQRKALDAVANILWDRCGQTSGLWADRLTELAGSADPQQAVERSIKLASTGTSELVEMDELLDGVMQLIQPLAVRHKTTLQTDVPSPLPLIYGDSSILRQIFVNVLAEGIKCSAGRTLQTSIGLRDGTVLWQLRGLDDPGAEPMLRDRRSFVIAQSLLGLYQGKLLLEKDPSGELVVSIALPASAPRCVFVIDDDPGAVELYRRYLQDYPCTLVSARTMEEVEARLAEIRPDLILLDVIMPQTDGWAILHYLTSTSKTADIPIVVCSVVDQPQLARALGATAVLTKPFAAEDLLRMVQPWLAPTSNWERAHPEEP